MALAIDLEGRIDPSSGDVTCRVGGLENSCPDSSLLGITVEYANSNSVWKNDFHDAFVKMTNSGCDDTTCIELL